MAQVAQVDPRAMRGQLAWIILPVNLLAAVVVFTYFRFVDYATVEIAHVPLAGELAYFVIGLAALIAAGVVLGVRWAAPLADVATPGPGGDLARRRAAQMPWAVAAITAIGWGLAGVIWGIVWPLLFGTFVPFRSARTVIGIVIVTGLPAIAAVFFIAEHRWRRLLPGLFPEGGLTGVGGVPQLSVRARLLAIFFLVSEIPVFVLGMAAYRGASTALAGGPEADSVMLRMLAIVAFLVLATIVVSAGLAFFVARSVAEPLGRLERAMVDVERGRFDVIGRLTEGFNHMVRGLGERAFLRETFGKYVSAEIRDEILAGHVALEGQLREATILFADIRDFTPWVGGQRPARGRARPQCLFHRDGDGHPCPRRARAAVHRRRDRGGVRRPGGQAEPRRGGGAGGAGHARAAGRLERCAATRRPATAAQWDRRAHRHRARRQHRQRGPPLLRARRRPGQPCVAAAEPHQGTAGRHPGERHDAREARRRPAAGVPAGGEGERTDGRGRGLRPRLSALGEDHRLLPNARGVACAPTTALRAGLRLAPDPVRRRGY